MKGVVSRMIVEVLTLRSWVSMMLMLFSMNSCFARPSPQNNYRDVEGHYSFSLTTFDTTGKLWQVDYATRSALEHTAVLAAKLSPSNNSETDIEPVAVLVARQDTQSPLVKDEGTSRFVKVNSNILMTPSGLSADGRIVMSEIQQLAIEYEYTFEENIPLERLLEDLSLCMQRYTMKAGVRPFGCSILVTYLPNRDETPQTPQFYRVNPSGLVELLEGDVIGIGNEAQNIINRLPRDTKVVPNPDLSNNESKSKVQSSARESRNKVVLDVLQNLLRDNQKHPGGEDRKYKGHTLKRSQKFLTASFSATDGLKVESNIV